MNFQIRDAITANMIGNNASEIRDVVEDAITRGEEHLLPGLGVFFEKWWKTAPEPEKESVLKHLEQSFQS
ncbi:MAG: small acid-soluble spore protein SspI [Planococcaceae bacterium]|jgi:small acid-soluble spore protein I (minor)|uniref:small acid-soluble spore protein SspI n=1 Tax=Paenisporosarcina quisquiliarum TaxID=365346 RepID=UPI0024252880|nr:small acid-soluble spore protein SspI [Bacillota bacterium]MDX1770548.1 small acid-soluble spore protein SspI [Planococcaceae bacterium]